ncbi:DUF4007 family protein [Deinococcus koreensis]|uniref:DUF4007 family protein n=1 Tax=Deinococcus koreensis TaxID=2054903 RepID=UPI0013FD93C1
MSKRIGTLFHETFPLSRPGIAAVLRQANGKLSLKELIEILCEEENLGRNWAKAVPSYARACGLMEFGSTQLTSLGLHVQEHDPALSLPATLWLMHYHLCAPQGPGPRFWHDLIVRVPQVQQPFRKSDVVTEIERSVLAESGTTLKDRGVESTATIFLGSYTKSDALGPLELLSENGGEYAFETPDAPPTGVFAYALSHYWQSQLPSQQTCTMEDFSVPGGFGSLFSMGSFHVNRALRQLARQGVLELWMAAPPYQVTRPPTPEKLLEGIYAVE